MTDNATRLRQLAGDIAEDPDFDTTPDEASAALRSALTGDHTPIRVVDGVNLNAA